MTSVVIPRERQIMADDVAQCSRCGLTRAKSRAGGDCWWVSTIDLSLWCESCYLSTDAHRHAYPDCDNPDHDGRDWHGVRRFITGPRADLLGWRKTEQAIRRQGSAYHGRQKQRVS